MKPTQMSMFTTEDLPLFSGTAPTTQAPVFAPAAEAKQETFAKCRFCMDTGLLGDYAFCWCQAGQDREALRRETGPQPVMYREEAQPC